MPIAPSIQTLIENGNRLFSERMPLLMHWQEIAEHFYFDRADFTIQHAIGEDYASGAMTSVMALARREMGNNYRTFLRPQNFFEIKATEEDLNKPDGPKAWLEYATKLQRSVMYRRGANFTRATSVVDHDHVTFGNGVIDVCPTPDRTALYYKDYHLRDVVWTQDYAGQTREVHRNDSVPLWELERLFPGKVPEKLLTDRAKNPYKKIKARHIVVPSDAYDFGGFKPRPNHPWVSIWVLPEENVTLETISRAYRGYVIPRADVVSGSQYAKSPFTSIILPDARTKMSIERILLEAGEKAVDPPMIAVQDALRSDIGLYAGGMTMVDIDYDERLGEALRPVNSDHSGLPFGEDMSLRYDQIIREGMMLTKINLPLSDGMTAYQIRKIMEQHMRQNLPIFEPVETDYNEPLCAETFAVMRSLGAFPPNEIPDELRGADIEFSFQNPMKDTENDTKAQRLAEGMEVIGAAAQIDQNVTRLPNAMEITKDTLRAIGWPADWINNDEKVAASIQAAADKQAAQETAGAVAGAAEAAGKAAPMVKALGDLSQAA